MTNTNRYNKVVDGTCTNVTNNEQNTIMLFQCYFNKNVCLIVWLMNDFHQGLKKILLNV